MGRLDVGDLEDGEAVAGRDGLGRCPLGDRERLGQEAGAIGDAGDHTDFVTKSVVTAWRPLAAAALSRPFFFASSASCEAKVCSAAPELLLLEDRQDLRLDLGERAGVRRLLILNLEDVVAELRLDDVRGLAGRQREGRLVELRNCLAAIEPAELSALHLAAGVVGVLGREVGEVTARLDLLQEIFGLGLRCGVRLGIGARRARRSGCGEP